jgi:hypothetical protein
MRGEEAGELSHTPPKDDEQNDAWYHARGKGINTEFERTGAPEVAEKKREPNAETLRAQRRMKKIWRRKRLVFFSLLCVLRVSALNSLSFWNRSGCDRMRRRWA